MAFCSKCGNQMADNVRFCPVCGTPAQPVVTVEQPVAAGPPEPVAQPVAPPPPPKPAAPETGNTLGGLTNTADTTDGFDKTDVEQNKVMAVLAYLGFLVVVPIFAARESRFARYHANQGLLLCIAWFGWLIADGILTAILRAILWRGLGLWSVYSLCSTVLNLVYLVFTVFAILGIVNALNGRAKELPVIGKYNLLK
ncbi:MAG: zinc ribbon domain-containing protein [Tannerella sp.]|nr:zinc ribbon domain-containing protein [Tannerella sp.]